jgi:hypothetical protein
MSAQMEGDQARTCTFSKHLVVAETHFLFTGSVVFSTVFSAAPTEVESSSIVDVENSSMGLESDFSVGEGLSQP